VEEATKRRKKDAVPAAAGIRTGGRHASGQVTAAAMLDSPGDLLYLRWLLPWRR
jgi:hypothetical protein